MLQGTAKSSAVTATTPPPATKSKVIDWGKPESLTKHAKVLAKSNAARVNVTPDLAAQWLALNVNNRPLEKARVAQYARDILANRWIATDSDPVKISSARVLINGQHRLSAIVEANRSAEMFVVLGADPSEVAGIDRGKTRSHRDVHILSTGEPVSQFFFSTANAAIFGADTNTVRVSYQEMEDFVSRHREALDYALGLMAEARGAVRMAPVSAVFARAFYHVDHDKLAEFANVLVSGMPTKNAHAIIVTLRDWLLSSRSVKSKGRSRYGVYRKTARALMAFVKGERIKTLYETSEEVFVLPSETKPIRRNRSSRSR